MAGITSDLDKNIQRPPETPRKGSPGGSPDNFHQDNIAGYTL